MPVLITVPFYLVIINYAAFIGCYKYYFQHSESLPGKNHSEYVLHPPCTNLSDLWKSQIPFLWQHDLCCRNFSWCVCPYCCHVRNEWAGGGYNRANYRTAFRNQKSMQRILHRLRTGSKLKKKFRIKQLPESARLYRQNSCFSTRKK